MENYERTLAEAAAISERALDYAQIAAEPAPNAASEAGIETIGDTSYMRDGKGRLVPLSMIADAERLEDQTVRKIVNFAVPLSEQVARFRQHSFDDIDTLIALLKEQFGAKKGGQKGNVTLMSYDGLLKVQAKMADKIDFGPELQAAKALIDEYLVEKMTEVADDVKVIIDHAFAVENDRQINRGALLSLRRLNITDHRWVRAMEAITASIRVIGTKRYINIYRRADHMSGWEHVVIDVAAS